MTVDKEINSDVAGSPIVFTLDPGSGVPTYLQLVHQVEHALRLGYLKQGDRLPKVREVVAELAINPNTVLKAYRDLESKGLTAGRPGQGTFIEGSLDQIDLAGVMGLRTSLLAWLEQAAGSGLDSDGIVALFSSTLRDFTEGRAKGDPGRGGARVRGRSGSGAA
jgi:GntR family transcriptional regulator